MTKIKEAVLKVNLKKSFFGKKETEYLGYIIGPHGIRPQPKKVEAILNLQPPKTLKQLRSLLGLVQYYRDVWPRRSHILAPLSDKSSSKNKKKFVWTEEIQQAFEAMKKMVAKETLLAFPDYAKPFDIYTDASKSQLGAVITQGASH